MVEDNYAISEENSDEQGTINKINVLPNQSNLTPINNGGRYNICSQIEETVESLLLDSGSTMTVINKKCLPKNCKTRKTAKDRMVNTLGGSYNTSEMVVMRNLRLPELDKNRNVDQQKAIVFESKTCKYDVILGADFLIKTGIDVKYSTRTIEWFEIELSIRDP